MTEVGGQSRDLLIDVYSGVVPAEQHTHGEGVPQVMDPRCHTTGRRSPAKPSAQLSEGHRNALVAQRRAPIREEEGIGLGCEVHAISHCGVAVLLRPEKGDSGMVDIAYSLETLTGKHGGLLEVVEAIVSDGRLIMILTDEDVLQRRDAPLKGVFYRVVLPLAQATMNIKGEAFGLVQESLKFPEDGRGLENLVRELGR